MMAAKPKPDLLRFITETLTKTVSASKSRLVIFCVILFLQFLVAPLIMYLSGRHFPDTYVGMAKSTEYMSTVEAFVELIKYILLLLLLIMSPAERTGKRRFAKYIVLFGSLYFWIMISIMSSSFEDSDNHYKLAEKSFKENAVPIYGKVVFSSYKRNEVDHKTYVAVAERLSPKTSGYVVIVQLNDSVYKYKGLKSLNHPFNDYIHVRKFSTNIPARDPNLTNCLQFVFDFSAPLQSVPKLPEVGKYVKILYDPYENGIAMYTDAASSVTPTFDSILGAKRK